MALGSCAAPSSTVMDAAMSGDPERIARAVIEDELRRRGLPTEGDEVTAVLDALSGLLRDLWGEDDAEVASPRRYVKYSNAFEARAIVDFDEGWLRVETIATRDPEGKLKEAMVETLLTTADMRVEDIFSDARPPLGGEPFLLGQVRDNDGEAIRWRWRAERYAQHLLNIALVQERHGGRVHSSLTVPLVDEHEKLREQAYSELVLAAADRYELPATLVYAVIEVESAFNPYAISPAKAYGLMQVVPSTAGRDVYERIKKRAGQPSRQELFQPAFNIDIGSAYLHLLDDVYLAGIRNGSSRRYATIAAYNGGAGSLLRTFHSDRDEALKRINSLSSFEVYERIVARHPFAETRRYLEKVQAAQERYRRAALGVAPDRGAAAMMSLAP